MALRLANDTASAEADAAVALLDAGAGGGVIEVRTGPQPANPQAAATGTVLLAFVLNDPAFGAAVNGVASLIVTPALTAIGAAAGEAGWFRAYDSDTNPIFDGACATSGAELNLSTTTVSIGLEVTIESGSFTQPTS